MKRTSGFTLIEVLVTITLVSILISMAVPSFKTTMQNGRMVSQANDLLGAMIYARSQAVALNAGIKLCSSTDAITSANPTCGGTANDWPSGWIIAKLKSDGTIDTVLRVHEALTGSNSLTNDQSVSSITFAAATGVPTASVPMSFSLCDARGASYGRSIYVNAVGEARIASVIGKQINTTTNLTC